MSTLPSPRPRVLPPEAVDALLLDTTPWLSCEECFDRMDTHVEALLDDPTTTDPAMERHLRGCAACDEEASSLLALLTAGGAQERSGPTPG
jgi:hypothetical protein